MFFISYVIDLIDLDFHFFVQSANLRVMYIAFACLLKNWGESKKSQFLRDVIMDSSFIQWNVRDLK